MITLHSFSEFTKVRGPVVIALGTFDGIHLGHQSIIQKARNLGNARGAKVMVLTFDAHPFTILKPDAVPPTLAQPLLKEKLLANLGVDYMVALPMNRELLSMSAESFLDTLLSHLDIQGVVVGSNFSFGKGGRGNGDLIATYLKQAEVITMDLKDYEQVDPISSTVIRSAIQRGDLVLTNALLGRPYEFTGTVITGDQRGRTLGFPTLNFLYPKEMALLPDGVYVNRVCIDGHWYGGVGNLGDNPTFTNQYHRFEVHLFDFDDMVYGKEATVQFLHFLRGEEKFNSLDDLIEQMNIDKAKARDYLAINC